MSSPDRDVPAELVRVEGGRVLAVLARAIGDLQLAEDALQDAAVSALEVWPRTGVPRNPSGWLYVAARRKALDVVRRESRRRGLEAEAVERAELLSPEAPDESTLRDDQLRLLFTVCHPSLALDAQVALALKVVVGLPTGQIARTLLTTETAMARRLSRTKEKIRRSGIPFRIPGPAELPERVAGVCAVIHQMFTVGHAPLGEQLVRVDLCEESVRVGRLLVELVPDEPTPSALLALLLLTHVRQATRTDPAGDPVPLAAQDRTRWDAAAIAEGVGLLHRSLVLSENLADPYQLQAAIAAAHSTAATYEATDWAEVVRLYDLLADVHPSPVVVVNAAAAVAELHGPGAGLARLDVVADSERSPRWHVVRGELLTRLDRWSEAEVEFAAALGGELSEPEQRHLLHRLDDCRSQLAEPGPASP